MLIVDILYIIFLAIVIAFASRQAARVMDNFMCHTMVFGWFRSGIARLLEKEYWKTSIETMPDEFNDWDSYIKDVCAEICKNHYFFRPLNCQYCLSFWFFIVYSGLLWFFTLDYTDVRIEHAFIYLITSIAFIDVFFKM